MPKTYGKIPLIYDTPPRFLKLITKNVRFEFKKKIVWIYYILYMSIMDLRSSYKPVFLNFCITTKNY